MNLLSLYIIALISGLSACSGDEAKKTQHLASLTCESSRSGRSQEELQAIGDACFRGGNYSKSSHKQW